MVFKSTKTFRLGINGHSHRYRLSEFFCTFLIMLIVQSIIFVNWLGERQFKDLVAMKNLYRKYWGVAVIAAFLLLFADSASAQTTYIKQNFSGPGPYTSKNPNATQFDTIYVQGGAILRLVPSQGYVEFERVNSSGGGSGRIVRSTNFSPTPSTIYFQVRVEVPLASTTTSNAAIFNVGQNFSPSDGSLVSDQNIFAKFSINFSGNNQYLFRKTGNSVSNSDIQTGSVLLTWVMNNSDKTHYYVTPNNVVDSLVPKTWDLWIDKVRFLDTTPRVSTSEVQLTDFSFQFRDGIGIIRLTDFLIDNIEGTHPVHLTYFNAQSLDNQVELNWETAWEQNSREFIVQRSNDLKEFGDVGRVVAAGESDGRRQYAFTDYNPLPGNNYYRLRMVDKDDTYEYSKVRDVIVRPGRPTLWVAANPTSGERIRVRASGVDATALRLTTIMGQNISFRVNQNSDGYTELIPAVTLAPGMYFLSIDQDGLQKHTKVLVH